MAVNDAEPSPVHGETIALALAELGRCDEALGWMKRGVAEAERAKNAAEAARLRGEMPKYEARVVPAVTKDGIGDQGRGDQQKAGPTVTGPVSGSPTTGFLQLRNRTAR